MLRTFGSLILIALFVSIFAYTATPPDDVLSLGVAGVAVPEPNVLFVAASLSNRSTHAVGGIRIERVQLGTATLHSALPLTVGALRARASDVVQAEFDSKSLAPGKSYDFVLQGTYFSGRDDYDQDRDGKGPGERFEVHTTVLLPPHAPGEHTVGKVQVEARKAEGARFPHQPQRMEHEVNLEAPPVPRTTTQFATPTPNSTEPKQAPVGDPPAITFLVNDPVGINGAGQGCNNDSQAECAEPSGASSGGMIFVSANWNIAYSTNGGGSFKVLDPTTIFPSSDPIGFCCDQIIQYAPTIDRFIWIMQGTGYRLATASPAQIQASNGKDWTYWDLTPSLFGKCGGPDYPDLSIGDNSLYMSWDAAGSCTQGFQVVRTSLAGIQAGGTITLDFTDPANAPQSQVWGEHLMQNTGDEIFWAGHNGNGSLVVYSLKEGSNTYFWRNVGISGWASNAPTSKTPDGIDWLAKNFNGPGGNSFPRNGIIGAARSGNQLWFGWSAGTDSNFKQAHIEIVELDRANNFSKVQQVQIWNNSYAFAYPAFSSNACTGELGMSFETGGNGNYENHVVGFWGDFVAYLTTGSNVGDDRFGDYVSIRRAPPTQKDPGNLFTAFGFGVDKLSPPQSGDKTDVRYILFGRPACKSR